MADVQEVELLEYVAAYGSNPFREWLLSLRDRTTRARIRARLNRVRLGNFGDSHSVGQGVHELRLPFGPGYRIYFGRPTSNVVVLLCGGDKAAQPNDVARARRLWKEYQRRAT
jgi:putative addiction module killer protein